MATMAVRLIWFLFNFLALLLLFELAAAASMAKPGCRNLCGNVSIPYPFGIGAGCYMNNWFEVFCNETNNVPTASLPSINMELLEISLGRDHFIRVKSPIISSNCSDRGTGQAVNLTSSPFIFSETMNMFIAVGCDSRALMTRIEPTIVGCESSCKNNNLSDCRSGGGGCCQAVVPSLLQVFDVRFESGGGGGGNAERCKLAFLAEQRWFASNIRHADDVREMEYVPAVLDWVIFNGTLNLQEINGRGSFCSKFYSQTSGYLNASKCYCQSGYEGNPYLPDGCQDIDECKDPDGHVCTGSLICVNKPGYFECKSKKSWITVIRNNIAFGLLCFFLGSWWIYKTMKKRRKIMLKKKFFKRNGGLLLQQQLSSREGNVESVTIFSSKELEKATNNFHRSRILGQGGQGTVYKGMLVDGRIVAVKKSKVMDEGKVEEFINEVVILSQINHRNVVNLLGCCLETEVPLLVYEFVPNGTLFHYLHESSDELPSSWEIRLRIAAEVAGALSYLHSAASISIFHRDIKSRNILLDEKYRAKISDFGTSRSIAIDETHLTTQVQGTFGYLDPEYFHSSQFTEKSDVYSFGVVLVELLTGEKPVFVKGAEEARSLVAYFRDSVEENRLFEILDDQVRENSSAKEEIVMVAKLAYRCLSLSGKSRPTMKEAAMELERMRSLQKQQNPEPEGMEYIDIEIIGDSWDAPNFASSSAGFDSGTTSTWTSSH